MKTKRPVRGILFLVLLGLCAWFSIGKYREYYDWPLAVLFGAVFVWIFHYYLPKATYAKPAPFHLVLRLGNDTGGDFEDDQTFEILHARFTERFPKSGDIRFDGFDTDGSRIWFYFFGPDENTVFAAVSSSLEDCCIRQGSYFEVRDGNRTPIKTTHWGPPWADDIARSHA